MKVSRLFIGATIVLSLFAFCSQNLIAGNEGEVKVIKEIKEHTGNVNFAWYSPDGKLICSADEDSTLKIWDAETGKIIKTFKGEKELYSASWSADGKTIAIADKNVKLWNIETNMISILDAKGEVETETVVRDYVKYDYDVDGYEIAISVTDTIEVTVSYEPWKVSFSPDGSKVVSSGTFGTSKMWDAKTGKLLLNQVAPGNFSWSPDGKSLACGIYAHYADGNFPIEDILTIIDAKSAEKVKTFYKPTAEKKYQEENDLVYSAEISPNGKQLLSSGYDKTIKIWDIKSEKLLKTLEFGDEIFMSKWSPDGKKIVSVSDKTIKIWDAETGKCIQTINDDYRPFSVSFSPDGTKILTAGEKGIKVWGIK
jgi:WD40 repeat protein